MQKKLFYIIFKFISLKCSTLFNSFLVQRTFVFHAARIFLVKNMLHFLVCRLFHANLHFSSDGVLLQK